MNQPQSIIATPEQPAYDHDPNERVIILQPALNDAVPKVDLTYVGVNWHFPLLYDTRRFADDLVEGYNLLQSVRRGLRS